MNYDEVISLGWKDRHPGSARNTNTKTFFFEAPGFDYHIMSVTFGVIENDGFFDQIMINCVPEKTTVNEWENSETHFYGQIKTKHELELVMQFIGIISCSLPPAEGAEPRKTCVLCTKPAMDNGLCYEHNLCNVPKQQQPTAEGAEAFILAKIADFKLHECYPTFVPELAQVMTEFTTLHAQRIADKMVSKQDEYIQLITDELDDAVSIAHAHGWRSHRADEGQKLRDEIANLKTGKP